jgi:hypothetical protein
LGRWAKVAQQKNCWLFQKSVWHHNGVLTYPTWSQSGIPWFFVRKLKSWKIAGWKVFLANFLAQRRPLPGKGSNARLVSMRVSMV